MKIAITGTIASGKTTLCNFLREKGIYVYDCDAYNAFLLEKDNPGYLRIKEEFAEVFEGEYLNKKALAKAIFSNPIKKEKLENILHPLILENMMKEAEKHEVFFAEVPILFESGFDKYFDVNVLVVCGFEESVNRLKSKGYSQIDAIERINNQMSIAEKEIRANKIIYNSNSLKELEKKAEELIKEYVGQ